MTKIRRNLNIEGEIISLDDPKKSGVIIRKHENINCPNMYYVIWDTEEVFHGRDASGGETTHIEVELCELVS
jgi:hypothetical protein